MEKPTEQRADEQGADSVQRMVRAYRNCSKEPHPGDLVMWNDQPTLVATVGPESAMFQNNKYGDALHLNMPEQIDLIEAHDGTKP